MKFIFSIVTILLVVSCGTLLAGGVGPPPNPMSVPLDGGVSAILIAAGSYIGYKAIKNEDKEK